MTSPKYISMGFLVLIIFLRLSSAHRVLVDSVDQMPKQSHLSKQPISTNGRGGFRSGNGGAYGGGIIGRGHECTGGGCSGGGYPGNGMPIYGPPYFVSSNPGFGPINPGLGCGCPCSCTGTGWSGGHLDGDGSSPGSHNEPMSSEAVKADQEVQEAHHHWPFEFAKKASAPDPPAMD